MAHDTVVFFEDKTDVASLDLVAALTPDSRHTVSGDNITVPSQFNQLIGTYATMEEAADYIVNAQLQSPSMKNKISAGIDLVQLHRQASASDTRSGLSPIPYNNYLASPFILTPGEYLNAYMEGTATAANAFQTVGVFLGDGNYALPSNLIGAPILQVRATSVTQPAANAWKALVMTMTQTLKAGRYAVVGARVQQTTARIARLITLEGTGGSPGMVCVNDMVTPDVPVFRMGGLGVWGEFSHSQLPQVEIFAQAADTASAGKFAFDLIQTG